MNETAPSPLGRAATAAAAATACVGAVAVTGTSPGGLAVAAVFVLVAWFLTASPELLPAKGGAFRLLQVIAALGAIVGSLATDDEALLRVGVLIGLTVGLTVPPGAAGIRASVTVSAFLVASAAVGGVLESEAVVPLMAVTGLAAMALAHEAELAASPRLGGAARAGRPWLTAIVAAFLVVALAPALSLLEPPPSMGAPGEVGSWPSPSGSASPYVSRNGTLDLADRPDWGDLDRTVLTVTADEPSFWRGELFDVWDGQQWLSSSEDDGGHQLAGRTSLFGWSDDLGDAGLEPDPDGKGIERLVQRVEVESQYLDLVVAAPSPGAINVPASYLVERSDGTIDIPGGLGEGASYTVESVRVAATAELLRASDPRQPGVDVDDWFVEVPPDVPERVRELAATLDGQAATTYDLVLAIHAWLGDNTEYTRELPALPEGADPVEQHLFVDRKGWCEQIATSSAVLLRLAGVPTRLATGFVPGERSLVGDQFRVRAGDAHAWVEVWFPGVGWQGFDPTASVPLAGDAGETFVRRLLDALGRVWPILAAIAVVLAVGAGALLGWRAAVARRRRTWTVATVAELERAGRRRGRPRRLSETIIDYADALRRGPLPDERLVSVADAVTAAVYGGGDPDPPTRAEVTEALADAQRAHPPPRWWQRRTRDA